MLLTLWKAWYYYIAVSEPQLQYAIFCRKVIDRPKEFSIIGVFDSLKVKDVWVGPSSAEFIPRPYFCKLVIGIVGLAKGTHKIWVTCRCPYPYGRRLIDSAPQDIVVEDSSVTQRVIVDCNFDIVKSGTYVFPVVLDDEALITLKLPVEFEIVHKS